MMSSHDLCMPSQPWKLLLCINLIKWPFCLKMLLINAHQQYIFFENSQLFYFAVISYELLINTICNALTPALHSVNKQRINEIYSKLMFFQCIQHETLYSYIQRIVFPLFCSAPLQSAHFDDRKSYGSTKRQNGEITVTWCLKNRNFLFSFSSYSRRV